MLQIILNYLTCVKKLVTVFPNGYTNGVLRQIVVKLKYFYLMEHVICLY